MPSNVWHLRLVEVLPFESNHEIVSGRKRDIGISKGNHWDVKWGTHPPTLYSLYYLPTLALASEKTALGHTETLCPKPI